MMSFCCKRCGMTNVIRLLSDETHLFRDNKLTISRGYCQYCKCKYVYIKKSESLFEIVFPEEDYGFKKKLVDVKNIYTSYVPVYSIVDDNKKRILEIKKKKDIVIGFDGWEDIVIDKELAGGWYMTQNSPPILDVAVMNCKTYCFGNPNIIMSYPPSPAMGLDFSILDNKTIDYFEEKRTMMLSERRIFYIGIKE